MNLILRQFDWEGWCRHSWGWSPCLGSYSLEQGLANVFFFFLVKDQIVNVLGFYGSCGLCQATQFRLLVNK